MARPLHSVDMLGEGSSTFPNARGWCNTVDGSVELAEFRALYDHFFPLVWRWASHLGVPRDARDDVVQEVFLTIHGKLDQFEARSSLKSWVFGVTVRVTRNYRRRKSTGPSGDGCEMDALPDEVAQPEAEAEHGEALTLLQQILNELDADRREVFVLAEFEQLSILEIAAVLHLNSNTVSSRLRRAREDVRAAWGRAKARDQWRSR